MVSILKRGVGPGSQQEPRHLRLVGAHAVMKCRVPVQRLTIEGGRILHDEVHHV
jgi:hypothetical protein